MSLFSYSLLQLHITMSGLVLNWDLDSVSSRDYAEKQMQVIFAVVWRITKYVDDYNKCNLSFMLLFV